jgi:L-aspartate oxidase
MENYHPKKELAPRDIVARAIDNEMKTRGESCCYLDITHKSTSFLDERFPAITAYCRTQNIHPEKDWIPVVPAAHYTCGGVVTNEWGETDIQGLFAAGEVAFTGVHGANRLASNSILEALVFSKQAVKRVFITKGYKEKPPSTASCPWKLESVLRLEAVRLVSANQSLKKIMWDYVGIVRSDERLQLALQHVKLIREEMDSLIGRGFLSSTLLENRSLSLIAEVIIQSALHRKECRGLHYNIDHKDEWQEKVDTYASRKPENSIEIQHSPVPK